MNHGGEANAGPACHTAAPLSPSAWHVMANVPARARWRGRAQPARAQRPNRTWANAEGRALERHLQLPDR